MSRVFYQGVLLLLWVLVGCTGSNVTSIWKSPDAHPAEYKKLMILGIIREPDRNVRISMEKELVGGFKNLGYNAFSAYEVYGPGTFKNMTEEQANAKLSADGVDAVLTVVLLDKQKERYYVPGRVRFTPYFTYHDRFWRYYTSIYYRIDEPGYYDYSTRYFWESNFYDLSTNKLVYSVQTQSFDPQSTASLAAEYSRTIIKAMTNDKIIENKTGKMALLK